MKYNVHIVFLVCEVLVANSVYIFRRSFPDFNKHIYNINEENNLLSILDNDTLVLYDFES